MRPILLTQFITFLIYCLCSQLVAHRSIYRPKDPLVPTIVTRWCEETDTHRLESCYLEQHALFDQFDYAYFKEHLLPRDNISYRNNPEKSVEGEKLYKLVDNLIEELRQNKKELTDFKVLKKQDFNKRTFAGYIILKFKEYPFVLKLSIETPQTFVRPYSKGWQPGCFFVMGGGINRYLSGFNRIKNRDVIQKKLDSHPEWHNIIETPRKWFILPSKSRWFQLVGYNIGNRPCQSIRLPGMYGIIADAIDVEKTFTLFEKKQREFSLKVARYIGNRLDPHIDNFVIEKETQKIVIVDTEHFASMIGLKKPLYFTSYTEWYLKLCWKCLGDNFMRDKFYRRKLQLEPTPVILSFTGTGQQLNPAQTAPSG